METEIFTVSRLNEEIKTIIEGDFIFSSILVQGEITSLNKHYTGHYYFKLRDKNGAILSCIMFSSYTKFAYQELKDGDEVICHGSINVYEKGGTYSLNVKKIEQSGIGKYLYELKLLEVKLNNEGYFSLEKKPKPYFPKRIAILTSLKGAAICDVVSTIQKKCRTEIYIFPCSVQGEKANETIINALQKSLTYNPDVIILTRGGGSKDDLYVFNDEELVKAFATCNVFTISAVGHSIDSSLIDKVSSKSCITPTDAGNEVILTKEEYQQAIKQNMEKIKNILLHKIDNYSIKLISMTRIIENNNVLKRKEYLLQLIETNFQKCTFSLNSIIKDRKQYLAILEKNLKVSLSQCYKDKLFHYQKLINKINVLSPLKLLDKGYSFLSNKEDKIISSIDEVNVGEIINLHLKDGLISAKIILKEKKNERNDI